MPVKGAAGIEGIAAIAPAPTAVAVADVVGAHGLQGLLRVRPYHRDSEALDDGVEVLLERGGWWGKTILDSVSPHGRGLLLVQIEGIEDRDAAEAAVGTRILVPAEALPELDHDEFYWHEVIGFTVETTAGQALGTVAETMSTGLNDVWTVRDGTREYLIPVIADVVRTLDRPGRKIVIEPMPGLLD